LGAPHIGQAWVLFESAMYDSTTERLEDWDG